MWDRDQEQEDGRSGVGGRSEVKWVRPVRGRSLLSSGDGLVVRGDAGIADGDDGNREYQLRKELGMVNEMVFPRFDGRDFWWGVAFGIVFTCLLILVLYFEKVVLRIVERL